VIWRSSAPGVASMDSGGAVTCVTPGQAVVERPIKDRRHR
jgi:hypothetical protein